VMVVARRSEYGSATVVDRFSDEGEKRKERSGWGWSKREEKTVGKEKEVDKLEFTKLPLFNVEISNYP